MVEMTQRSIVCTFIIPALCPSPQQEKTNGGQGGFWVLDSGENIDFFLESLLTLS